jgi:hypothetical protein
MKDDHVLCGQLRLHWRGGELRADQYSNEHDYSSENEQQSTGLTNAFHDGSPRVFWD